MVRLGREAEVGSAEQCWQRGPAEIGAVDAAAVVGLPFAVAAAAYFAAVAWRPAVAEKAVVGVAALREPFEFAVAGAEAHPAPFLLVVVGAGEAVGTAVADVGEAHLEPFSVVEGVELQAPF